MKVILFVLSVFFSMTAYAQTETADTLVADTLVADTLDADIEFADMALGDIIASEILRVDSLTKATMEAIRIPSPILTTPKLPSITIHKHTFVGTTKIPVAPFRPNKIPVIIPVRVPDLPSVKVPVVRPKVIFPGLR